MPTRDIIVIPARALAAGLALASCLAASGCSDTKAVRTQRVPVTVAKVQTRNMPLSIAATGMVEPIQTADVGSEVGGTIQKLDFHEGDEVVAGQKLFELDPRPFRAALEQAVGQLERDRAQEDAAVLSAERSEKLFQQNLLAQQDWDTARATAQGLVATVKADSAAVNTARLNLEYATIRSPIEGRTGKLNVHVGDYVKSATSDPLVTVNQIHPIYVRFTVPENERPDVQRYRDQRPRVFARPATDDSVEVSGALVFVDNTVDPTTGTLTLKGEFPNSDGKLWPGEFVQVRLVLTTQHNAIVVPAPAINNGQTGTYVYVMNPDSSATTRPVSVERSDDVSAIVASGLKAGETVVTDGQFRISPGARLQVRGGGREARP